MVITQRQLRRIIKEQIVSDELSMPGMTDDQNPCDELETTLALLDDEESRLEEYIGNQENVESVVLEIEHMLETGINTETGEPLSFWEEQDFQSMIEQPPVFDELIEDTVSNIEYHESMIHDLEQQCDQISEDEYDEDSDTELETTDHQGAPARESGCNFDERDILDQRCQLPHRELWLARGIEEARDWVVSEFHTDEHGDYAIIKTRDGSDRNRLRPGDEVWGIGSVDVSSEDKTLVVYLDLNFRYQDQKDTYGIFDDDAGGVIEIEYDPS